MSIFESKNYKIIPLFFGKKIMCKTGLAVFNISEDSNMELSRDILKCLTDREL